MSALPYTSEFLSFQNKTYRSHEIIFTSNHNERCCKYSKSIPAERNQHSLHCIRITIIQGSLRRKPGTHQKQIIIIRIFFSYQINEITALRTRPIQKTFRRPRHSTIAAIHPNIAQKAFFFRQTRVALFFESILIVLNFKIEKGLPLYPISSC